jgi:hypothetical protein
MYNNVTKESAGRSSMPFSFTELITNQDFWIILNKPVNMEKYHMFCL